MATMINRRTFLSFGGAAIVLGACAQTGPFAGSDRGAPVIYRIDPADTAQVQFRMLDNVNALRATADLSPMALNAALNAAAATHSRDMAVQNRPWHFGSDGSSPIDRARRAGYAGTVLGENISETYEAELATIAAWMVQADTRNVITDPRARDLGVAFFQEDNGKLWWTLLTGDRGGSA